MSIIRRLSTAQFGEAHFVAAGRVTNVIGLTIEANGFNAPLGARCEITTANSKITADVVGFKNGVTRLQALESMAGIEPNAKVVVVSDYACIHISDELKGKVISPTGEVLIGSPVKCKGEPFPLLNSPLKVSERGLINKQLDTGVKVLNSMFPLGVGQRIGLFAGTGVGKSVLLSMITKRTEVDIVVIALVGERGREVSEFFYETLDEASRSKSIIVAAPSDTSPIMRMQCAEAATSIAEYYREKGLNVLLLIDSVTRYAQAQREVALSNGEPPATKGYPPSVFAKLPALLERAGKSISGGAITAIYTVLTEGDDFNDPIADAARGSLDGHIVLSREIAGRGIYPAVDVNSSISRLAQTLLSSGVLRVINELKSSFQMLEDNADLINMGVIEQGKNKRLDKAIEHQNALWNLVKQDIDESFSIKQSIDLMSQTAMNLK